MSPRPNRFLKPVWSTWSEILYRFWNLPDPIVEYLIIPTLIKINTNKPSRRAILAPGKIYHIYTRGNNQEILFKARENYPYFLGLWFKHISPIADTFAFCLLSNHFHFAKTFVITLIHLIWNLIQILKPRWYARMCGQPLAVRKVIGSFKTAIGRTETRINLIQNLRSSPNKPHPHTTIN